MRTASTFLADVDSALQLNTCSTLQLAGLLCVEEIVAPLVLDCWGFTIDGLGLLLAYGLSAAGTM